MGRGTGSSPNLRSSLAHVTVEMLPDPEGLRATVDGPIVDPAARDEAQRCATARAEAILTRDGAKLRADLYDPSLIAGLSIGTVGLMLAKILSGEIQAKDAKQAIDIARIALAISDKVTGADANPISDLTGDTATGRAAKVAKFDELMTILRDRAKDAIAAEARSAGTDRDVDLSEFDLSDDDARPAHLHAVRSPA